MSKQKEAPEIQLPSLIKTASWDGITIAYRVGFYNPSHFTSQFRKYMGMTPKMFRDSNW